MLPVCPLGGPWPLSTCPLSSTCPPTPHLRLPPPRYELVAVLIHKGGSASHGHYGAGRGAGESAAAGLRRLQQGAAVPWMWHPAHAAHLRLTP